MTTLTGLQIVWNSFDSQMKVHKASPMVKREVEQVRAAAPSIKNIDDLMKNRQVFNFVLEAYGMSDMPYPAMIKKLLTEGTKDPKAFANGFVDTRYREFVKDMGFGEGGTGNFGDTAWVDKLVAKYERLTFEEKKGDEDTNIRLALHFERKASSVSTWYEVLGDKAMAEVAMTAMGLSKEAMMGDIDKLATMLEKRMPAADFKNPEKVKTFLQRFAILSDSKQPVQTPILTLMQGGATGYRTIVSIDPAMLAEASRMRFI